MKETILKGEFLEFDLDFSYNQFYIYDQSASQMIPDLTEIHLRQGFARLDCAISIYSLLQYGKARVRLYFASEKVEREWQGFQRVLAIPLNIVSGRIVVDGPESPGSFDYPVECGHHKVFVGQKAISQDREEISIILEAHIESITKSEILVADPILDPSDPLIETANPI